MIFVPVRLDTEGPTGYRETMKKPFYFLFLGMLIISLGACESTFHGVEVEEGATYFQGELRALLPAPLPRVEKIVAEVMEELDFVAIDSVSDKLKGEVHARMADGKAVKVEIEAEDFESTEVRIRVGTFGDQSISRQIYKHIQRRIK